MHIPARHRQERPEPEEAFQLFLQMLDFGWDLAIAAEIADGAQDSDEAARRVAVRWKREDARRLEEKLSRWRTLEHARRHIS